jgi:hypothetical protein
MKHTNFILIVMLLFCSTSLFSQNAIGIKAGVNFPTWNTSINGIKANNSRSIKYQYGGFLFHRFGENISIQTEFLYQQMGVIMDRVSYDQTYFYVPLILIFDINDIKFSTGFQVGKLMNAKSDFGNIKPRFNPYDYQLLLGTSYVLSRNIELELRYGMGVNNIANKNVFNILNDNIQTEIKNNTIGLSLNYYF